jgi:hypothetical protein
LYWVLFDNKGAAMKKMLCISFCAILFFSCVIGIDDTTGKLVIQNNSGSPVTFITDVWTHTEGSLEWINRWHGSKQDGEEITLYLEPNNYDLKIRTDYLFVGLYYETGYKRPAAVKTNTSKIYIFDGIGIYDMEDVK